MTDAIYDDLVAQFGPRVATMVAKLSKDYRLPREEADQAYLDQLCFADWRRRLVKLADVYDDLCGDGSDHEQRKHKAEQALQFAIVGKPLAVLARHILASAIATKDPNER